jgi:hypothetical protein
MESRFQRDQQFTANRRPVNTIPQIPVIFLPGSNPFAFSTLSVRQPMAARLQCGEQKMLQIRRDAKRKLRARKFSLILLPW